MSAETHAAAFKTRLAIDSPPIPCLDLDEAQDLGVPGGLPDRYTLIYISRRSVDQQVRFDGAFAPIGWRLTTRAVARSVSDAREIERRNEAALVLNPITLDGQLVDVRYETGGGDFLRDDEGYYSAPTDWIYVR